MANKLTEKAKQGSRILNENIKRDYKRLLTIVAGPDEADFEEVEALANKYRMYFDDNGELKEVR